MNIIAIQSFESPGVFLRMDGREVTKTNDKGGGTVNCQFGAHEWETFNLIDNPDGTVSIESVPFPGVFLRMDGGGVTGANFEGGGIVNCQFGAGEWQNFRLVYNKNGSASLESVRFPGVFLRMDGDGLSSPADPGGGTVNCQANVGLEEMFIISAPAKLSSDTFLELMEKVRDLNEEITTDKGEWDKYAEICSDAETKGLKTYIERCSNELWTNKLDQHSWRMVKLAAENARGQKNDKDVLKVILNGFLLINDPSHNSDQWAELKAFAINKTFHDGLTIEFNGADTRGRRTIDDLGRLPKEMSNSFLLKRGGLPARYDEILAPSGVKESFHRVVDSRKSPLKYVKRVHVEYFMRLNISDADGAAYFIITHSQNNGGYVALAKVEGKHVGKGTNDHKVTQVEPKFAGEVVWWDHLDKNHPGGCNHPGNGGQIGSITVLVGQDWTKSYPVYGHVVAPVGKGSKVLFYDFSSLNSARIPSMGTGSQVSDAYMGCLTTQELGLRPGDDGEVSSANIEQGPDGMFYLIAGNANQTVVWKSPELVPNISKWSKVEFVGAGQLNDGSSQLGWSSMKGEKLLYYIKAEGHGMAFHKLKYDVIDGKVAAVYVEPKSSFSTQQADTFGDGDWVSDNGSVYVGASGGIALLGAYKSINDEKGPTSDTKEPCIQVRAWYSP